MKKITLTLLLSTLTLLSYSQETQADTTKKDYKNVIAIDATGLLQQFFNFNTSFYNNSPYIITYKRIFKSNALRFGMGGSFRTNEGTQDDTLPMLSVDRRINFGIGFEHYSYISKRWNFFFGGDAIFYYRFYDGKYPYTTISYREQSSTTIKYGVSPLLGVQFKINSRLSLSTETSFDILYSANKSFDIEPPLHLYDNRSEGNGFESNFNPPTSLSFRILF